jgi:hypothetical protein
MTFLANIEDSSTDLSDEPNRTFASCYSRDKVSIVRRRTVSEPAPTGSPLGDAVPRPVSVTECHSAGPMPSQGLSRFSIQVVRRNGEADLTVPDPQLPASSSPTKVGKFSIVRVPRPPPADPDVDIDFLFGVRSAQVTQLPGTSGFDPLIDIF